jgi:hypothetical protein
MMAGTDPGPTRRRAAMIGRGSGRRLQVEAALRAGDSAAAREAIARDIGGAASDLFEVLGEPARKRSRR